MCDEILNKFIDNIIKNKQFEDNIKFISQGSFVVNKTISPDESELNKFYLDCGKKNDNHIYLLKYLNLPRFMYPSSKIFTDKSRKINDTTYIFSPYIIESKSNWHNFIFLIKIN